MGDNTVLDQERESGRGTAILKYELRCKVKHFMREVVAAKAKAEVTDCTIFEDKVLIKGVLERDVIYRHYPPHKTNDKKKDKKDKEKKGDGLHQNTSGWCKYIDSNEGPVHFYQENLEFAGLIDVPGMHCGDKCIVECVEVKEFNTVLAEENDENGFCEGKHQIKLLVTVRAVRR